MGDRQAVAEYKFDNLSLEVSVVQVNSSFNHVDDNVNLSNNKIVIYIGTFHEIMVKVIC